MTDKVSGKRRGFVFVEFTTDEAADKATVETFHTIDDVQVCSVWCVCNYTFVQKSPSHKEHLFSINYHIRINFWGK